MQKSILSIAIFLLGLSAQQTAFSGYYDYDAIFHQKICVELDKDAHNSNWTKRDNTARFRILAKYSHGDFRPRYFSETQPFELRYDRRKYCFGMSSKTRDDYYWQLDKYKLDVTYGGDCEANIKNQRGAVINFTIHHRKGDLINPWSCTSK